MGSLISALENVPDMNHTETYFSDYTQDLPSDDENFNGYLSTLEIDKRMKDRNWLPLHYQDDQDTFEVAESHI